MLDLSRWALSRRNSNSHLGKLPDFLGGWGVMSTEIYPTRERFIKRQRRSWLFEQRPRCCLQSTLSSPSSLAQSQRNHKPLHMGNVVVKGGLARLPVSPGIAALRLTNGIRNALQEALPLLSARPRPRRPRLPVLDQQPLCQLQRQLAHRSGR